MASKWHKKIQKEMIKKYKQRGYEAKREKKIGFEIKITRKTQFKQVDIVAQNENEIILIEIEDRTYHTKELGKCDYGVSYVELGGILLLSWLFSKLNSDKSVTLLLIFRNNIVPFRKENIKRIISELKNSYQPLEIRCQYL